MTDIYLVRHPESTMNIQREIIGGRSSDARVTPLGEDQARRFAIAFQRAYPRPNVLFSSPAIRTRHLAETLTANPYYPPTYEISDELHEMSQGLAEGQQRQQIYTDAVEEKIARELFDFALPGGESINAVADRMMGWMRHVHNIHKGKIVLAATHGLAIRCAVGRLLDWSHYDTTQGMSHITENVSLARFSISDDSVDIISYGENIIKPVPAETDS